MTKPVVFDEPVAGGWLRTELHGDSAPDHIYAARMQLGGMRSMYGVNDRIANGEGGGFYRLQKQLEDGTIIETLTNDGHDTVKIYTGARVSAVPVEDKKLPAAYVITEGAIVGYFTDAASFIRSFLWSSLSGFTVFGGTVESYGTVAQGVSGDGEVVTGTNTYPSSDNKTFIWTKKKGVVEIGPAAVTGGSPPAPFSYDGSASGGMFGKGWLSDGSFPSADGSAMCGLDFSNPDVPAYYWSKTTGYVYISALLNPNGISGDGRTVVGSSAYADVDQAFYWTKDAGIVYIGFLPGGTSSIAYAASYDGSVIVGSSEEAGGGGPPGGWRWTKKTGMVKLPDTEICYTIAGGPGGRKTTDENLPLPVEDEFIAGTTGLNGTRELVAWVVKNQEPLQLIAPPGSVSSSTNCVSVSSRIVKGIEE